MGEGVMSQTWVMLLSYARYHHGRRCGGLRNVTSVFLRWHKNNWLHSKHNHHMRFSSQTFALSAAVPEVKT